MIKRKLMTGLLDDGKSKYENLDEGGDGENCEEKDNEFLNISRVNALVVPTYFFDFKN